MPVRSCRTFLLLFVLLLAGLSVGAAISIDGFSTTTNDRFANDPAFIADAYDLSGIGINESGRWGTLLSGTVVISAWHYFPAVGSIMTFYRSNDPGGEFVIRQLIAGQRVESTDLWLGVLEDPVPSGYAPLPFTNEPIANANAFAASSHAGQPAFMIGRSPTNFPVTSDLAAGANVLNDWAESVSDSGTVDQAILAYQDLPGDPDYLPYEAYLQGGDSGAPLLRVVDGVLTVIGINWFIGTADIDKRPAFEDLRNLSGFSYVGNYAASIQSAIEAFAVDATAGYIAWMGPALGTTEWAVAGPALDFDGDGLDNFTEYAFVLDPTSPASVAPVASGSIDSGGSRFLLATFSAREDPDLAYVIEMGSDLDGWSGVQLSFDGAWSSSDPAALVIQSATGLGDGAWRLSVRETAPLAAGTPRFIRIQAR